MISLPTLFVVIYAITVIVFLFMPKKRFNNLIERDIYKDFAARKPKDIGYYRIVIAGGAIFASVITLLIKVICY